MGAAGPLLRKFQDNGKRLTFSKTEEGQPPPVPTLEVITSTWDLHPGFPACTGLRKAAQLRGQGKEVGGKEKEADVGTGRVRRLAHFIPQPWEAGIKVLSIFQKSRP